MSKALPAGQGGYMAAQAAARGLGPSTSTALIAGDRRKIHTSFAEKGAEMVEEYDVHSDQLLLRKLRHKSSLGSWGPWIFEIGEPVAKFNPNSDLMLESSNNPLFVRQDLPTHFQFRIRNLPWDLDNYSVEVDAPAQELVLRTKNKKYFKRFSIPDLKAGGDHPGARLDEKFLSLKHANNTLLISYVKPPFIVEMEAQNRREIRKMGNGATSASSAPGAGSAGTGKQLTTAQKLLADAQASGTGSSPHAQADGPAGGAEFSGLSGLKGLAGKDGDCKQQ